MTVPRLQRDRPEHAPPPAGDARTVAGRYRLLERLHERGTAEVHRAWDELTGAEVAIKLLPEDADAPQLRAEVAALRLLHLPGVARLLDEGQHGRRPFLALELVVGDPFPGARHHAEGAPLAWSELRDRTVSLLEVLARVHDRGVIHRDLKPDNVLVTESGRPVVLDFGLSAGVAIGSGRDPDRRAVGTPAYAAPEQLLGEPLDARADLYALGVMLYEALAGRGPQPSDLPDELIQLRLGSDPEPLAAVAAGVPRAVARLVDDLLARDPDRRPRSAADCLRRLAGGSARGQDPRLPWLGGERLVDALRAAVASGRPVALVGEPGSGRRRLADQLAERLRAEGRRVIELGPAVDPLRSLGPLAPGPGDLQGADLERALDAAVRRVLGTLETGTVVLAAGFGLDRWSVRVLDRLARGLAAASPPPPGALVRGLDDASGAHGVVLELEPLTEGDLWALFAGPDRVFHLCEDGARELFRRTEGHPARVVAEVAAWIRAGLARWSGQRLAIDRQALGRLAMGLDVAPPVRSSDLAGPRLGAGLEEHLAWVVLAGGEADPDLLAAARGLPGWRIEAEEAELVAAGALRRVRDRSGGRVVRARVHPACLDEWTEDERRAAHGRLADLLEPGATGRLLHLVSAGRTAEVPGEALVVAHGHLDRGELAPAEAALVEGLIAVRAAGRAGHDVGGHAAELRLLQAWLAVALADFTPQALDRVLYEAARAGAGSLERFAKAALLTLEHPGERALTRLEAVGPLDDPELERWRHALLLQAARGAPPEREAELLEDCRAWCATHDTPDNRASLAEWTGRLLYREDRHLEAAEQFEVAAAGRVRVTPRLSARLNAASALLEAGEFRRATDLALSARELAAGCRHELFEVRAEWILRASAYRRGSTHEPDLELVEAAGRVGVPDQAALIALTEAAVAWRGRHREAPELARRAASLWAGLGKTWGTMLAGALALAAVGPGGLEGPDVDRAELADLAARALECPDPGIGGQALALLVRAGLARPEGTDELARTLAEDCPEAARETRREVLSIAEVLAAL